MIDVKTIFLNGEVEEEVCIENPKGFAIFRNNSHVWKLKNPCMG